MCTNGNRWRAVTARAVVAAGVVLGACDSPTEGEGTFTVGGTVSGLGGVGCVLRNNGGDELPLTADGRFTFATPVANGAPFDATVFQSPRGPNQTCVVSNGSGTVSGGDVTNIAVTCTMTAPPCANYISLGSVNGDQGAGALFANGTSQRWYRARLIESSTSSIYVSADVELTVPPGVDYDLRVYCLSCGGTVAGSSRALTGIDETVQVRWEDRPGPDDSADILIQVVYYSGQSGTPWQLQVSGNTSVLTATCSL